MSYDWVFVGAGNMLVTGHENMISSNNIQESLAARIEHAFDRMDRIEHSINELANRIDRSLAHQAEMTNVFFKKIDDLTQSNQYLLKSEQNVKIAMQDMTEKMTENRLNGDKLAKSYWESVAFASDSFEIMKEINQKISEPGSSQSQY
ncbi:hypothetical protein N9D55_06140 [Flavobacteriaceae bacterium]|nr:hypothetical protein [Flavobacteriaceae bacterium]